MSKEQGFTESVIEGAALTWLESLRYTVVESPETVPGVLLAEREHFGQVVFGGRAREAIVRLNPELRSEAQFDAFRKLRCGEARETGAAARGSAEETS